MPQRYFVDHLRYWYAARTGFIAPHKLSLSIYPFDVQTAPVAESLKKDARVILLVVRFCRLSRNGALKKEGSSCTLHKDIVPNSYKGSVEAGGGRSLYLKTS